MDRPARADRGGVRLGAARVRPARARGRGRDQGPPAAEARGLRRHALHRAEARPLHRRRRESSSARSCVFVGDDFVVTVRHGEAERARTGCARTSSRGPSCSALRARRGAARDRRPGRRRLPAGGRRGSRSDIEEVEDEVFSAERHQPGRAHLQAQARGARSSTAPPRRWSSRWTASPAGRVGRSTTRCRPTSATCTTTWPGSTTGSTGFRDLLTSILAGQPGPGHRPPERRRAPDLGLGGDRRRADHDRRHLRHELRAHARAALDARLPAGAGASWSCICVALYRYFKRSAGSSAACRPWPTTTASSARSSPASCPAEKRRRGRAHGLVHGHQPVDARARAGDPARALARTSTRSPTRTCATVHARRQAAGRARRATTSAPTGINLLNSAERGGLADRLPLPRPRDPALRGRPAAACPGQPMEPERGRAGRGGRASSVAERSASSSDGDVGVDRARRRRR